MVQNYKSLFRIRNKFSFNSFKGASYVGRFELREYDEVVSWSFVFDTYARQDQTANEWITEQLGMMNEARIIKAFEKFEKEGL